MWFDCAVHRPIRANTGGLLGPNLGLVLHHAVMNGSLFGFFGNPAAQVSAHFWVSRTGVIEQYVSTNVVAWHGRSLNSRYVGVETDGCATPPYAEPMTEPMVAALGRLYAEGMRRHGWPAQLANADGQRGFGFHRMAVQTACPCDVRLNMRTEILRRAQGGAPAPAPEPPPPLPPWLDLLGEEVITALTVEDGKVWAIAPGVLRHLNIEEWGSLEVAGYQLKRMNARQRDVLAFLMSLQLQAMQAQVGGRSVPDPNQPSTAQPLTGQ